MDNGEHKRLPANVPGKYYTTEECDGCAYCASVAPENFDFEKETNTYFVSRQPQTPEEEEFMIEAMDDCPVDAIRTSNGQNGNGAK
ncbi:MAG: ferredoxin [Bacteroidota bacterium]